MKCFLTPPFWNHHPTLPLDYTVCKPTRPSLTLIRWRESTEAVMVWELDAALSRLCRGPRYRRRVFRRMWRVVSLVSSVWEWTGLSARPRGSCYWICCGSLPAGSPAAQWERASWTFANDNKIWNKAQKKRFKPFSSSHFHMLATC